MNLILLTSEHIGKFVIVRADERAIPVKIISLGDGMLGCAVLDSKLPLRSFKIRYNVDAKFEVFDTPEEAVERMKQ